MQAIQAILLDGGVGMRVITIAGALAMTLCLALTFVPDCRSSPAGVPGGPIKPPFAELGVGWDMTGVAPAQWPDLAGGSGPIDPPPDLAMACVPGACVSSPSGGYTDGCTLFSDPTCSMPGFLDMAVPPPSCGVNGTTCCPGLMCFDGSACMYNPRAVGMQMWWCIQPVIRQPYPPCGGANVSCCAIDGTYPMWQGYGWCAGTANPAHCQANGKCGYGNRF